MAPFPCGTVAHGKRTYFIGNKGKKGRETSLSRIQNLIKSIFYPKCKDADPQELDTMPSMGSMYRTAFRIAWPATVEAVFVALVSFIDTMMVSSLGTTAVAAVGLCNQPKFICLAVIMSLNVGVTAIIARRIGEGDEEAANRCLRESLTICLILCLLTCGLSFLFARPFILLAGAQEDTIDMAVTYFRILLVGQFFQQLTLTINAAQRCVGNSKLSMRTNVTANVINIIFNYLLINGHFGFPAWGVAGAAFATSLGNVVAFFMACRSLLGGRSVLQADFSKSWRPTWQTLQGVWKVASSALLENFCTRTGFFVYALIVANLGTLMFATHQICMNICNILFSCFDGFSASAAALVGQRLGAKRPGEAELYGKICNIQAFSLSTLWAVLLIFFRGPMVRLFSEDAVVLGYGEDILLIVGLCTYVCAISVVYAGALRGAGDTKFVALISFACVTILRPVLAWVLCYPVGLGIYGPWIALAADMWIRGTGVILRYGKGCWKQIAL